MVIECSSCHARFKLADDKIKESGTRVRCTKCSEVFTVFPEPSTPIIQPVVAVPPVPPAPPAPPVPPVPAVITPPQVASDALFFSETEESTFSTEMPFTSDDSISQNDNWDQDDNSDFFTDPFADDDAESVPTSVSRDAQEEQSFSLPVSDMGHDFDFSEESELSFSQNSIAQDTGQTTKKDDLSFTGAGENDIDFDDFSAPPSSSPSDEELSPFSTETADTEFTLAEGESLSDFSFDVPDSALEKPTTAQGVGPEGAQTEKAFDFNSFSFDTEEKEETEEVVSKSETKIELAQESETEPDHVAVETNLFTMNDLPAPVERATPRPNRTPRTRPRKKKKSPIGLIVKIIILVVVGLSSAMGFMNREKIHKIYVDLVNKYIEGQTRIETTGQITITKLSNDYILNKHEGDLFIIRGEALNDFKDLRSSVLVKGTLYGDNGKILKTQSAYCGNPLQDSTLKNSEFKEILNAMSNELGSNLSNLNVPVGKKIPFTIVFNKPPANIKEFNVEVLESKPGSK